MKIAFSAALLALAGVSLFAYLSYRQHAGHVGEIVREELAATVRNAAPLFSPEIDREPVDLQRLTEMIETLLEMNERTQQFRLFALENGQLRLLVSSVEAEAIDVTGLEDPTGQRALAIMECIAIERTCVTPIYSDRGTRWVSAYSPLMDRAGRIIGVLAGDRKAVELERLMAREVQRTIIYGAVALAASIALGFVLSIKVTRPLKRLYRATAAVGEGRYEPVKVAGRDEIAALARHFNETHEALVEKMRELEALAAELENRVHERTQQLSESYEDARRTRDFLQREISVARRVQETIVPRGLADDDVVVDVEYLPIMGLGGDWGIVSRRREGHLDIAIGDVTGHGLGAALVVNRVYTLLSQMCASESSLDALVNRLDFFLAQELSDIGIYMTFTACRLDLTAKNMRWIGAGHPPMILCRGGRLQTLESNCGLLGVGEVYCENPMTRDLALQSGDMLILHTDGVSDAFNDKGEVFGLDRVRETIVQGVSSGSDGKKIAASLTEEVKKFTGGRLQDDVMIIVATII